MNSRVKLSRFLIFLSCMIVSFSGFAQESDAEKQSDIAAERPGMPSLFFTVEQRRILEAIRQGAIAEDSLQIDEFVPLILVEEILPFDVVAEDKSNKRRTEDISVDAFIYNNKKKQAVLWLNGKPYSQQEQNVFLNDKGISAVSFVKSRATGEIVGTDQANKSKFVIRVGQKLSGDGGIGETYPVVVVKKNKNFRN